MNIIRQENERKLIQHYNRYNPHDRDRIQTLEADSVIHHQYEPTQRRPESCSRTSTIARDAFVPFPTPSPRLLTTRVPAVSQNKADERELEERVNSMVEEVLAFISLDIDV